MKKLWGFVNLVGLLIAAAGFITHSAVLIVLGIAVCLLGEWQKSRVSKAQRAQAQTADDGNFQREKQSADGRFE